MGFIRLLRKNYKKIWKVLKPLFLLGLLGAFFYYIPVQEIINAVRSIDVFLFFISFLFGLSGLYMSALKLWFFSRVQGLDFSANKIFVINVVVRFYSFFSPASIVGSGLKWYKMSSPGKETQALLAVTVSRFWDVFMAVFWGFLWMLLGTNTDFVSPIYLILFVFSLILLWLLALRYSSYFQVWSNEQYSLARNDFAKKAYSFLNKLFQSFSLYKLMCFRQWLILLVISIIAEISALFGYTILAFALSIPVSFIDLGWMRSIFFLSALAPFTLVGGIGLREASVVVVMSSFGVITELAVAYSFLLYSRSVLLYLIGGVVELFSFFKSRFVS